MFIIYFKIYIDLVRGYMNFKFKGEDEVKNI